MHGENQRCVRVCEMLISSRYWTLTMSYKFFLNFILRGVICSAIYYNKNTSAMHAIGGLFSRAIDWCQIWLLDMRIYAWVTIICQFLDIISIWLIGCTSTESDFWFKHFILISTHWIPHLSSRITLLIFNRNSHLVHANKKLVDHIKIH